MGATDVSGNDNHRVEPAGTDESALNPTLDVTRAVETVDAGPSGAARSVPFTRFHRRMDRIRTDGPEALTTPQDDEPELRLQLMLLREENVRLKSERHEPPGPGPLIEQVRALSARSEPEAIDDAWSMVGECLQIQAGLDQACVEIVSAVEAVRGRLHSIAERLESSLAEADDAGAALRVMPPSA